MLLKISLVVALCSNLSTQQIQSKMHEVEARNPGSKVTLRLDQKAECTSTGEIIAKKSKRVASN